MTGMTKGLKVPLVVEEGAITLVRYDVIDVGRHHDLSLLEALFTIGVLRDEAITQLLPSVRVSACVRVARDLYALLLTSLGGFSLGLSVTPGACFLMAFTVAVATRHGAVTSRICAQGEQWHDEPQKKASLTQRGPTFPYFPMFLPGMTKQPSGCLQTSQKHWLSHFGYIVLCFQNFFKPN